MLNRSRPLWVLTAMLLASCGGDAEAPATEQPGGATVQTGGSTAQAAQETTVRLMPTGTDELPPAIVGEGGDMMGMSVQYVPGDDATEGYLAVPSGEGPFPALVIVHEWNGLVDRVRQVADDLAAEGYVVLAADLYQGQVGTTQ